MKKSCILIGLSLTITIAGCTKENLNSAGNDQFKPLMTNVDPVDPPKEDLPPSENPGETVEPNGDN